MKLYSTLKFIITSDGFYLDQTSEVLNSIQEQFHDNRYHALYHLGFQEQPSKLHPSTLFLFQVSEAYIKLLTSLPELEIAREESIVEANDDVWNNIQGKIPYILGNEFVDRDWLNIQFTKLNEIFSSEIKDYDGKVALYLAEKNQSLKTPERIFFHLVENKDDVYPFAFMATYATKTQEGKIRHMPLTYALEEYKQERNKLLSLLSCLNKASEACPLLSQFVQSGELFHPLKITTQEAYEFLKHVEAIEASGILCRIPNWWRKKYASVSLNVKMGEDKPSLFGFDSLISLQPVLVVDGVELTKSDVKKLLQQSEGLALLKGKWVEVDHEKLRALLEDIDKNKKDITLLQAIRGDVEYIDRDADNGILISNGSWLASFLQSLRNPTKLEPVAMPKGMNVTLRPYQTIGFSWLHHMSELGFGACLADDMGLGKTVQVLSFLQAYYEQMPDAKILLIVPASLLENWRKEGERFAPKLPIHILHGRSASVLKKEIKELNFVTVTTYGMVSRLLELSDISWNVIILDEAQAIKNPLTAQTKSIKHLKGNVRIAMTGTPIENDLTNLWSLFDFLNKGLLGTSGEFKQFSTRLQSHPEGYEKLKAMVSPFILRRLKTDKTIIDDLPDKIETIEYITLSKQQIVLYRNLLNEMEDKILNSDGMEHRGIVLSAITKLKQICNHPDQYLGEDTYSRKDSGKFEVLKELCETIYEKRERVLIFTQYKEIIPYLCDYLESIFHKRGYVIHGGVPVKQRGKIVEQFNAEEYVPYIVCSLKAAGTGLNLTSANHVIHFDRWWNPSVENQATDRAFRIGQKKNVMVHKFVCKGTIEEKIDQMINSKKALAESIIGANDEHWITELQGEDLMNLLRLDM
ncbi:DEAD/DEAH box helicase [Amedibacillus sp. YH-ame6]